MERKLYSSSSTRRIYPFDFHRERLSSDQRVKHTSPMATCKQMGNSFISELPDYLFLFVLFLANLVCVQSCIIFPHQSGTNVILRSHSREITPNSKTSNDKPTYILYRNKKSKRNKSRKAKKTKKTFESETKDTIANDNVLYETIKYDTTDAVQDINVLSQRRQNVVKNAMEDISVLDKTTEFETKDAIIDVNVLSKTKSSLVKDMAADINIVSKNKKSKVTDPKLKTAVISEKKKTEATDTSTDKDNWQRVACWPRHAPIKTKTNKGNIKSKATDTRADDLYQTIKFKTADTKPNTPNVSKTARSRATDTAKVKKKTIWPQCTYADVVSNTTTDTNESCNALRKTPGCSSTDADVHLSYLFEAAKSDVTSSSQQTTSTPAGSWLRPDPYDANLTFLMFMAAENQTSTDAGGLNSGAPAAAWGTTIVTSRFVRSNIEFMTTTPGSRTKYNQWEPQHLKLDLHDRTLQVALKSFYFFYCRQLQYYQENGYRDEDKYFFVVTGHCRNRSYKVAKIKPEIQFIIHELHLSHYWFNKGGEVMIELATKLGTSDHCRKRFYCNCWRD